jgi:hypothetical protein
MASLIESTNLIRVCKDRQRRLIGTRSNPCDDCHHLQSQSDYKYLETRIAFRLTKELIQYAIKCVRLRLLHKCAMILFNLG